ncbi:phytanoyl-CoA dioxygenase family protein [Bacteroidia bacterium]|nr:phytanoyl-CoA dioxygenase family protein [Bacteroidia bacterium]MDB9881872.1 phytanoyl-CoA dioxygenase family protein [Bacteroidia bacterium]
MAVYDKYTGFLRRIKVLYLVHNVLNIKYLRNNKTLYKRFGLKRPTWFSLSSKHFSGLPNKEVQYVSKNESWEKDGYIKLQGHFDTKFIEQLNEDVANGIESKIIDFNYTGKKILFAYEKIPLLKEVITAPSIRSILEELVGHEVLPFQSINFQYGSEQAAHSDSVHMATYPSGGLIAIWVAFDDIAEDNGPLFYYPGSHKLPYATNVDIGNSKGWLFSPNPNKNYENYQARIVQEKGLKKEVLSAKKGDVFVWHANLLHGGMPHLDKSKTRRSMVVHYFIKDRICYHELSQRPAIVKEIY